MDLFSISQLAEFSGVKQHTIRIWEQRYNALKPQRSEGNTRYYDNDQLRRLLNIVSLKDAEYKVSELCAMSDKKLFHLVSAQLEQPVAQNEKDEYFISQLIAAGMAYDEAWFDKVFSHALLSYGLKDTYLRVLYPMLVRVGLMWATDTIMPAYEHFISNMIRNKLIIAIDALPPPKHNADSWLLFLPEDEYHEIGLLLAHYLIRHSGKKVYYLGASVPLDSVAAIAKDTGVSRLLTFFVMRNSAENVKSYMSHFSRAFASKKIFISCKKELIIPGKLPANLKFLFAVEELEKELDLHRLKN
jgi:MerR family transcriptional regulator, light-induced transcriptional regulator